MNKISTIAFLLLLVSCPGSPRGGDIEETDGGNGSFPDQDGDGVSDLLDCAQAEEPCDVCPLCEPGSVPFCDESGACRLSVDRANCQPGDESGFETPTIDTSTINVSSVSLTIREQGFRTCPGGFIWTATVAGYGEIPASIKVGAGGAVLYEGGFEEVRSGDQRPAAPRLYRKELCLPFSPNQADTIPARSVGQLLTAIGGTSIRKYGQMRVILDDGA